MGMDSEKWAALPGRLVITSQNGNLSMTIENILHKMGLLPENPKKAVILPASDYLHWFRI